MKNKYSIIKKLKLEIYLMRYCKGRYYFKEIHVKVLKLVKNEWIKNRFVKVNAEQSQYWSGTGAEHKQMDGANIKKMFALLFNA